MSFSSRHSELNQAEPRRHRNFGHIESRESVFGNRFAPFQWGTQRITKMSLRVETNGFEADSFFRNTTKVLHVFTVNGATQFFSVATLEKGLVFRATIEPDS